MTGAPKGLADVVGDRYDGAAVTGKAETGRWRGAKVAVVTGTGEQDGDVTLAVRAKGEDWRVVGGWWPSLGKAKGAQSLGGRTHVLVVGSDARPGEPADRSRADAIQLLGVDGEGGAGLMGFARDLWVPIPGHGQGKLNAALVYGGPDAQVAAVEQVSGIEPAGYVVTGFSGFTKIVDELGGLSFDAPRALDSHLPGGQIPEGESTLSGKEALSWARERKTLPGGDFDRSRNQGLLIAAAALQARMAGPQVIPEAMTVIDKHATSNLSAEEMLLFSAAFFKVSPTKVGHTVAKGPVGTAGGGQSVVFLGDEAKASMRDFADGRLGG